MKTRYSPIIVIILIVMFAQACSFSLPPASAPAGGYRYDNLPDATHADIAEYKAISKWDKTNISYFFRNSTDKIAGEFNIDLPVFVDEILSDSLETQRFHDAHQLRPAD